MYCRIYNNLTIILLCCVAFLYSCSRATQNSQEEFILSDSYSHIVKYKGETLATIAGWYTGKTKNWEQLAKINKLQDPGKIEIGQKIFVPNSILKRFNPLPEEMIVRKTYIKETKIVAVKPVKQPLPDASYKRASLEISKPPVSKYARGKLSLEESLRKMEQEKSLDTLNKTE